MYRQIYRITPNVIFSQHCIRHNEKLRTRMRIKSVDLKKICKQNGERVIIDLYIGVSKTIVIC